MSRNRTLKLPEDLAAFAQMQVDTGNYGSVVEVVREAFGLLQDRSGKVVALRKELDVGIAQLDAGESTSGTPREMMDGIRADIGLTRIRGPRLQHGTMWASVNQSPNQPKKCLDIPTS